MEPKTILITGANRGLGFELGKQLAEKGHWVILSGRSEEKIRNAGSKIKGHVHTVALDVSSASSVRHAASEIQSEFDHIDVLVNNAAILQTPAGTMQCSESELHETLNTNVIGAWRMIKTFYPMLEQSKQAKILNISSGMGALDDLSSGHFAYRLSKIALNALTIMSQSDLGDRATVIAACPGWVKTDMGGAGAAREIPYAAEQLRWLVETDNLEGGKFYRDKKVINW